MCIRDRDYLMECGVDKSQIISVNFEDIDNEFLLDYKVLHSYIADRLTPGRMTYVFLDEIQAVEQFQKAVDSLFIKENVDIYITGSNAYMLSGELATLLSGRYMEIQMLPLSFGEYYELVGEMCIRDRPAGHRSRHMKTKSVSILLFFGVIAVLFSIISLFTAIPSADVEVDGGAADLTGLDLSREIATVRPEYFDYYPGAYRFPGSFEDAPLPRFFTGADKSGYQYGTFRVMLHMPGEKTYALRAMSVNFSQRTWIDGVEQQPVGWPGETALDTIPAAHEAVYVFTPKSSSTEIVMQYANFVYRDGGEPYPLYISVSYTHLDVYKRQGQPPFSHLNLS